jgi:cyanuric acid amidohydrolase
LRRCWNLRQGGFAAIKLFVRSKFSETAHPWRLALPFLHAKDVSLTCRGGSVIGQFFRGDWGRGVAGIGMRRRVDGGRFMSVARGNSMRTTSVGVVRIATKGPGDVSGLLSFIESGKIDPRSILAILGKTEGNGGVNDFTREYAVSALCAVLAPYVDLPPHRVEERIAFVMSGGTEGVLSPHITVFTRADVVGRQSDGISGKRLSIGIAQTRDFVPEELGRGVQIEETAKAVATAMADAAIVDPQDVHFVQIKCPLLTSDRIEAASGRGNKTVTNSAYGSMAYSRGASALGVAVALGEINGKVGDECILRNFELFSSVASTSAGIELMHNVIIVLGNSASSASPFVIGHAVMRDAIDSAAVIDALKSVGIRIGDDSEPMASRQLVNIFAKAEASPNGSVRGFRHTMLEDTDISATRHARAAVGGLIGGLSGTGAVYVSGGAEHQGPPGGGPVAAIARLSTKTSE